MGGMRTRLPLVAQSAETECRRCGVVCQKVIEPLACLERECPYLYVQEQFGRRYVGCLQKVFGVEIDLELLERSRRRRNGFGSIRAVRQPLPGCPASIERAYEHRAEPLGCVNPEFHELPDRPGFRVTVNAAAD